jgi:hypothetical protein
MMPRKLKPSKREQAREVASEQARLKVFNRRWNFFPSKSSSSVSTLPSSLQGGPLSTILDDVARNVESVVCSNLSGIRLFKKINKSIIAIGHSPNYYSSLLCLTRPQTLDVQLLYHPLFQKVFYVFLQRLQENVDLEFWRDAIRFRMGANRSSLSIQEEANLLMTAYINPFAQKNMSHLSGQVREAIINGECTPLLYWEAELVTALRLVNGPLQQFKQNPAFVKIMRFVKFDPKQQSYHSGAIKKYVDHYASEMVNVDQSVMPLSKPSIP